MRVIFHTNLDMYKEVAWPVLDYKPNVGEFVYVHPGSENLILKKGLPPRLVITEISHRTSGIHCELWYHGPDMLSRNTKTLFGQ